MIRVIDIMKYNVLYIDIKSIRQETVLYTYIYVYSNSTNKNESDSLLNSHHKVYFRDNITMIMIDL